MLSRQTKCLERNLDLPEAGPSDTLNYELFIESDEGEINDHDDD